jgi:hypothetical protein
MMLTNKKNQYAVKRNVAVVLSKYKIQHSVLS